MKKPTIWLRSAEKTWLELATDDKGTLSISRIATRTKLRPGSIVLVPETLPVGAYDGVTIEEVTDICGSTAGQSKDFAVLVSGEPAAHTEGIAVELGDVLKRLEDFATKQEQGWESKKSVRISEAGSEVWQNLQNSPGFKIVPWSDELLASHQSDMPAFKWNDKLERAQSVEYMTHLQKNIRLASRKWSFVDAANAHPALLTQSSFGYQFRGTTDVVVVDKAATRLPETALKVVIELRKSNVDSKAMLQTVNSLVLANAVSEHFKPVAMLTDLCDTWLFVWMDCLTINYYEFKSRATAVGFLEDFLGDEPRLLLDDNPESAVLDDIRAGERSR